MGKKTLSTNFFSLPAGQKLRNYPDYDHWITGKIDSNIAIINGNLVGIPYLLL
jgi:hypothetical protein